MTSKLIALANARGSNASTTAGAWRYLLHHMPFLPCAPIPDVPGDRAHWHKCQGSKLRQGYAGLTDRQSWIQKRRDRIATERATDAGLASVEATCARMVLQLARAWPYRFSSSSWAGGELLVGVAVGRTGGSSVQPRKVWSSNGKWSGNNLEGVITVSLGVLATYAAKGLEAVMVGGLLTLELEPVGPRAYRAAWLEQGRGLSLTVVRGWIVRGHHQEGGTLEQATKAAARARKKAAKAEILARLEKRDLKSVWLQVGDALAGGACAPGTEAARRRIVTELGGEVGAVRADVALSILADQAAWVRRAVSAAVHRTA